MLKITLKKVQIVQLPMSRNLTNRKMSLSENASKKEEIFQNIEKCNFHVKKSHFVLVLLNSTHVEVKPEPADVTATSTDGQDTRRGGQTGHGRLHEVGAVLEAPSATAKGN